MRIESIRSRKLTPIDFPISSFDIYIKTDRSCAIKKPLTGSPKGHLVASGHGEEGEAKQAVRMDKEGAMATPPAWMTRQSS